MPTSISSSVSAASPAIGGGNVDKVLFKNLVEMVPLVESLMDKRAHPSFTRRASMIYTATPSLTHHKALDHKGSKASQTVSARKRRGVRENALNKHDNGVTDVDDFSIPTQHFTAESVEGENELTSLQGQLDSLHNKLLERDDALKSAEETINQMKDVYASVTELKHQLAEKDSFIKSINSQFTDAKIKLADKQAALEKLDWEARTSCGKVEELKDKLDSVDFEISALMKAFTLLSNFDSSSYSDENITYFENFDYLPPIDSIDDTDREIMEEARMSYVAAVDAMKENPSDELIAAAAEARERLEIFLL